MNTIQLLYYSIRSKRSAICNRCFPGPTWVDGISIASAVFAGLTRWQTDWQPTDRPTDHATRSVTIGGAQWRSQILLLSTATTTSNLLEQTDRINFSNQQLYSAVKLDGLQFMWRHTTIKPRKEPFPTGLPARWHYCLLIYWRTSCLVPAYAIPSVTFLRLSDASVICRVTYFQFPIQSAFLHTDPVLRGYSQNDDRRKRWQPERWQPLSHFGDNF